MTPDELRNAQRTLGLSASDMARMLDTDPQTWRRMVMREDASTFRRPAPRMLRLLEAYLSGYRPPDWPQ